MNVRLGPLTIGCVILVAGLPASSSEKTLRVEDLPPAVQRAVHEVSRGATLRAVTMERDEGKLTYEAALDVNGHGKDVSIDAAGAILEIEEEIALEGLPAPVKDAIQKAAPAGTILKVESITRGDAVVAYEAKIRKGGKKSEIRVKPDGSLAPED